MTMTAITHTITHRHPGAGHAGNDHLRIYARTAAGKWYNTEVETDPGHPIPHEAIEEDLRVHLSAPDTIQAAGHWQPLTPTTAVQK